MFEQGPEYLQLQALCHTFGIIGKNKFRAHAGNFRRFRGSLGDFWNFLALPGDM